MTIASQLEPPPPSQSSREERIACLSGFEIEPVTMTYGHIAPLAWLRVCRLRNRHFDRLQPVGCLAVFRFRRAASQALAFRPPVSVLKALARRRTGARTKPRPPFSCRTIRNTRSFFARATATTSAWQAARRVAARFPQIVPASSPAASHPGPMPALFSSRSCAVRRDIPSSSPPTAM